MIFLQLFILVDVLLIGLLAPVMYRHFKAHYHPDKDASAPPVAAPELSSAAKDRLLKESETKFEATITHSVNQLQHTLDSTTMDVNNLIKKMAVDVVNNEVETYRHNLDKLHAQAVQELGGIKQAVDQHQAEFQAKMAQEMAAEKARLLKQIDTKLGDAVSSFLLETLGHNVDLGSQTTYLMQQLEEHKADFAKEVSDDKPAA